MTLKQKIQDDMKIAMKAHDTQRLGTIRLLMAAIKQKEIDDRKAGEQISLDDSQVLAVIDKMIKQRQDSVEQFKNAGRQELVDQEQAEITVLQTYLPPALSNAEIQNLIKNAMAATGANSMKDMGKVMAHIKPEVQGRADMSAVSNLIKSMLGG